MLHRAFRSRSISRSIPRATVLLPAQPTRQFHTSPIARGVQELTREAIDTPLSLWNFTEEENMIRETVKRFAQEVIQPKVREMDETETMDPDIIKGLFENGVRSGHGIVDDTDTV